MHEARTGYDLTLQDVAERARCSPGYVHKLEADRVHTPSPRALAGLADALGVPYPQLMAAAGYEPLGDSDDETKRRVPTTVKRYSNAHIVELLEGLQSDAGELRRLLETPRQGRA